MMKVKRKVWPYLDCGLFEFWNIIEESSEWGLDHGLSCTKWNSNLKFKTRSGQADKQQIHDMNFLSRTLKTKHWTVILSCTWQRTFLCCLTEFHVPLCSNLPEFMWRWFLLQTQHVHLPQRPDRPILWIQVRSLNSTFPFPRSELFCSVLSSARLVIVCRDVVLTGIKINTVMGWFM